jgi:hypothetical protein
MMNADSAKELKSSLMWASVVEELDRKIHFELIKLRSCTPAELPLLQATIKCYESLKNLPDDVIDREST